MKQLNEPVKHTSTQLKELAASIHAQRICRVFLENAEDKDFAKLDDMEKFWTVFMLVKSEFNLIHYEANLAASNISPSILNCFGIEMPEVFKLNNITPAEIRQMADNIIEKRCRPILISGATGSGKSTLGSYLLNEALKEGLLCKVYDYSDTTIRLCSWFEHDRTAYEGAAAEICSHDAIMLDDCFMDKGIEYESTVLRDILNRCAEKHCTVLISSQNPVDGWYDHFNDPYGAESVLDRTVRAAPYRVTLAGDSLRSGEPTKIGADPDSYTTKKDAQAHAGGTENNTNEE